jgi:hypothetical protein
MSNTETFLLPIRLFFIGGTGFMTLSSTTSRLYDMVSP